MIVVLGSINIDIRLEVDSLPLAGETIHARNRRYFGGGKGANQVLAAKRAGADVAFFGAVGDDQLAQKALSELIESGVPTSELAVVQEETGSANIYVDRQGENIIVITAGANAQVDTAMASAAVSRARGGFLVLQQEIPVASLQAALEGARLEGVRTILNVSPFDENSAGLARLADIVIANQHEWSRLSGDMDTPESMKEWCRSRGQTIVVTRGAGGVALATPADYFETSAPRIQPMDTVGAGDTFCGYLAAALDLGRSLRAAVDVAVKAGSLACLKPGAQASIPTLAEVQNDCIGLSRAFSESEGLEQLDTSPANSA